MKRMLSLYSAFNQAGRLLLGVLLINILLTVFLTRCSIHGAHNLNVKHVGLLPHHHNQHGHHNVGHRPGVIKNYSAKPAVKPLVKPTVKPNKNTESSSDNLANLVIYMAGDGNLEPYVDINRKQLEREGVPANLNVILCMCTHRANEPKMAIIAQVKGNKTVMLEKILNLDSGDKKSLLRACMTTIKRFGKGDFSLILWDHGYGPINRMPRRGICYDGTTGNFLTDTDLRDVCAAVKKELGKNISMLGCDACLMACSEIGYAVKESVDYLLASEQTIPALGWPYHLLLQAYKKAQGKTENWGKAQVVSYKDYYDLITQDYTLSLINLKKLDALLQNLQEITSILNQLVKSHKTTGILSILKTAGSRTVRFDEPAYADLFDWYQQILLASKALVTQNNPEVTQLANRLRKALSQGTAFINQAVVSSVQGKLFNRARGIFAYIPQKYVDRDYLSCLWAQDNPQWIQLLSTICSTQ